MKQGRTVLTAAISALPLVLAGVVAAQSASAPIPFTVVGFIQSATVDSAGDPLSGGTLTVNGLTITIPRNTILQMPATAISWADVFAMAPDPYRSVGQSGLALSDNPAPRTTYEVTVYGNRVGGGTSNDLHVAGLVFISPQSLNSAQGVINYIDYGRGELRVGGVPGDANTGARVALNDPIGRFGKQHSPDPRLTIDEDNPTVRAQTGYPMCIARVAPPGIDAVCPETNRPRDAAGRYFSIYTMPPPAQGVSPDATQQTPFEIGDYVTYSGTPVIDSSGEYISAWSVVANLGIFTSPGSMPAYVAIETVKLGVAGNPDPLLPQEAVDKLFAVGFSTDPTQSVDLFAMDVNACNGTVADRYYTTQSPIGPPTGALAGRWRARLTVGNFLPPTRELRVTTRTLTGWNIPINTAGLKTYANGLLAGQYHAPIGEYLFPENGVIGSPAVPLNFQDFPFLANGSGPYTGSSGGAGTAGQLSPWPGAGTPSAVCNGSTVTLPPIPDAGPSQTVASSTSAAPVAVTLDGSHSADQNTPRLPITQYDWRQVSGPAVTLSDPTMSKPTFIAPVVNSGSSSVQISFQMSVSNGVAWSAVATTTVTVLAQSAPAPTPDRVTITLAQFKRQGSKLTVNATSSDLTGANQLTLRVAGQPPLVMTNALNGTYTIAVIEPSIPSSVTVVSSGGGSAIAGVVVK